MNNFHTVYKHNNNNINNINTLIIIIKNNTERGRFIFDRTFNIVQSTIDIETIIK
jgi:hypothetical protein